VICRHNHAVLIMTLCSWGWRLARRREKLRWSGVDTGMAALVFMAVWSLPLSLAPGATLIAIVRVTFSAVLVLLFSNLAFDARWLRRLSITFVCTAVASAILGIVQYMVPAFPIRMIHGSLMNSGAMAWRAGGLFEDPNFFGAFLGAAIVSCAAAGVRARSWNRAGAWLVASAVCGGALFLTLSRGSWVGTSVGLAVVAFTSPPKRRVAVIAGAAALLVAIALLAPTAVRERALSSFDIQKDLSAATRWHMLGSTAAMARDHWLFGVGLSAYDKAYPRYKVAGTMDVTKPHDVPITLVAEAGLPGALAQIALLVGLTVELRRRRGAVRSAYGSAAVAGLASLGVGMLFENFLYVEYVWLFAALVVVAGRLPEEAEEAGE
jgi:O-antigen ligase